MASRALVLVLLALSAVVAGCVSGPAGQKGATDPKSACPAPTSDPGQATGPLLRVYVGNDMGEDTCLDITLAGALFVSTNVATTPAGLHASPTAVRDTRWSGATIAVAAAETARGMRAEKEIPLGAENHLVVLADPGGISIQVYDHAPASV